MQKLINKYYVIYIQDQPWSQGSCVRTDCHLSLGQCPRNEKNGLGDLTVKGRSNNVVACLSPCKRYVVHSKKNLENF